MSIPNVSFFPAEDSAQNIQNKRSLRQLGFSQTQIENLCGFATQMYKEVLERNVPDLLLEHAPRDVALGGFISTAAVGGSNIAAYVEHDQTRLRNNNGKTEVTLKEGPVTMRLNVTPSYINDPQLVDQIASFLTHECIHLATRHAISSLMRGPTEALAIAIERYAKPKYDDQLTTTTTWGWQRELAKCTDGLCPADFEDIAFYNQTSHALYIAAATAFQDETEEQLWSFAAQLTEIALRTNAAPVKADIEQVVHSVFPRTATAILQSPAFKQISQEGLQMFWITNTKRDTAIFYPYKQGKIAQGTVPQTPLSTFEQKPVRRRFTNTFLKKDKTNMGSNIQGGGDLLPGEIHTVESMKEKLKKGQNPDAINLVKKIGGMVIHVPGTTQTVRLHE